MKKYNINVNGKSYEVEVEEIGGSSAPVAAPVPKAAVPVPVPKTVAPASAPKAAASEPALGAEVITSPMPGKIISVRVKQGQTVKSGDVVLILEAMKMENQLFAGASGNVSEIRVAEGDAVKTGDVLVVIS